RSWQSQQSGNLNDILFPKSDESKEITKEIKAPEEKAPHPLKESHISQENHTESKNETHIQNEVINKAQESTSSEVIKESKISVSKAHQSQIELPLNEPEHQVSEKTLEVSRPEKKSIQFSDSIHREDWIEGERNIAPHHHQNKDEESKL
ncbi:MAG: hypothetical protein OXB86_00185, partial [Bdellovibrionales bacterium]|nr:hypothetical protein [Bdellovibrionales bacterium]